MIKLINLLSEKVTSLSLYVIDITYVLTSSFIQVVLPKDVDSWDSNEQDTIMGIQQINDCSKNQTLITKKLPIQI